MKMKKMYTALFALGLALGTNAQINSNLVAYYPFTNSLNDVSGNNYHLSGYGHLFGDDRNGTIHECMYFDSTATSGKDSVTGITQLNDQEMTISFWIKADSTYWNTTKSLNSGYSEASAKYTWSIELNKGFTSDTSGGLSKKTRGIDSTSVSFYAYNTNFSNYAHATLGVPNNQWAFVTITFKALDSIRTYINGVKNQYQYSTVEFPFPSLAGITDKLNFGHLNSAYFNQLTQLDEFKIYNKQATDAEILQMYTSYPLGINSMIATNPISIFPNPATNSISFSLEHIHANAKASILSMDGKLMSSQPIQSLKTMLNTAALTKGLYILNVTNGEQHLTSKFSKE